MASSPPLCIFCSKKVHARHHAISCDMCGNWQHRKCGSTGITVQQYRAAVADGTELQFICSPCEVNIPSVDSDQENEILQDSEIQASSNDSIDSSTHDTTIETSENVEDHSVRIDRSFAEPNVILERSIQDPAPTSTPITDIPIDYELIVGGTQRGKDLLVDSRGYSYNVKEVRGRTRKWRCSVRNGTMKCPAGAIEREGQFKGSGPDHIHEPDPARTVTAKITNKVKDLASKDMFKSARTIVEEVSQGVTGLTNVEPYNLEYIARAANRYRKELRPEDPKDLNFELDQDSLPPQFLRGDIHVDDKRHLIFASDQQLELLRQARRWYVDGTFKVGREPFTQLLSIHAFVRRGDCSKQVPLVYIFMSRRTTTDYIKVLQAVGRCLNGQCVVEGFVAVFEKALWNALRYVFQGADIRGCTFHWGQAVWKHVLKLGLSTQYTQDVGTYCYERKLLCLPVFPAEHIQPTFEALCDLNTADNLIPLLEYIDRTWMQSTTWPVTSWSVFGQSVRTNNDVEGWNRKINGRAGASPAFHLLVRVLYQETQQMVNLIQLVTEMKLRRIQRKSTRAVQAKVFDLWERYKNDEVSTTRLLKEMSLVYKHPLNGEA